MNVGELKALLQDVDDNLPVVGTWEGIYCEARSALVKTVPFVWMYLTSHEQDTVCFILDVDQN